MRGRTILLVAALFAAVTALAPATAVGKQKSGFKTSRPPMLTPVKPGVTVTPLLTVGDTLASGYRFEAIPDGISLLNRGRQKVNVHPIGGASPLVAAQPTPGSGDLCFLSDTPLPRWLEHLKARGVNVIEGPVRRTGAQGPIDSVYFRDPDGNLVEVSNPVH